MKQWQEKIFAQLQHYKKKSPFYKETVDVIKNGFAEKTDSITKLNFNTLRAVCEYLKIPFNCTIFSERNLKIDPVSVPDEWALNICKALKYDEYINPPGGMEFFDPVKYDRAGIKLIFEKPSLEFYSQRRGPDNFEPGLSIIDVMMFNSPEQINDMLAKYEHIIPQKER